MKQIFLSFFFLFLVGCSGLQPTIQEPVVNIKSFKIVPSSSITPKFEIDLNIINTSRTPLEIKGIVYTIDLKGSRVLTGVAKDLETIPSYSEGNITVWGSPDLFGSLGLINNMIQQPNESITYELDISIDTGDFHPILHTTKKGELSLSDKAVNNQQTK